MKVAFLLPNIAISGGIHVALSHANAFAKNGHNVTLVTLSKESDIKEIVIEGSALSVVSIDEVKSENFDLLITTWWKTIEQIPNLNARKVINFVQSLEFRFYGESQYEFEYAKVLQLLPTSTITVANWISSTIGPVISPKPCVTSLNGLGDAFLPTCTTPNALDRAQLPLRILVEGPVNLEFKGVKRATEILQSLPFEFEATLVNTSGLVPEFDLNIYDSVHEKLSQGDFSKVLSSTDVLLKLSTVEGMFGPPLEAFSRGATVVCYPVSGSEEYIRDQVNAIVVPMNEDFKVTSALIELNSNRKYLESLQREGTKTAQNWESMQQSSQEFYEKAISILDVAASSSELSPLVSGLTQLGNVLENLALVAQNAQDQLGSLNEHLK